MPKFTSQAQWDKARSTGGFGGAIDVKQWEDKSRAYEKLPERLNPPKIKKLIKLFG